MIRWYQGFLTWLYGDFQLVSSKNGLHFIGGSNDFTSSSSDLWPSGQAETSQKTWSHAATWGLGEFGIFAKQNHGENPWGKPICKSLQNETLRILFLTLVSGKTPPYRRDFRCRIWYVPRSVRWWCFSRSLKRPPSDFATWKRPPPKVGEWWEGDFLLMRTGSDP